MGKIDAILREKNIMLPKVAAPVGSYVPYVVDNGLVTISGQLPLVEGAVKYKGVLVRELDVTAGADAARLCALNVVAQLHAACGGDLDRVRRCVRLGGFVAATADFADHPKVVNGASELIAAIFGEAGRHARAAVGCVSLPLGAAVEVEATFRIE